MTVQAVPLPTAPAVLLVPLADHCDPCQNDERMLLFPVGSHLGVVVDCPACTRRGARHLRDLWPTNPGPEAA